MILTKSGQIPDEIMIFAMRSSLLLHMKIRLSWWSKEGIRSGKEIPAMVGLLIEISK